VKAKNLWFWPAALTCVFAISTANAQTIQPNLVGNGGFETGDFTDWTLSGNLENYGVSSSAAHSGNYGAFFEAQGSQTFLSQQLPSMSGGTYTLDFWLQYAETDPNNLATVSWNNQQIYSSSDAPASGWIEFTFTGLTATSASTPLVFGFQQDAGALYFDDVSVYPAPVPEPSTWCIGACGLALLGAGRGRLRRAASSDAPAWTHN
jgi:hypothetical protein